MKQHKLQRVVIIIFLFFTTISDISFAQNPAPNDKVNRLMKYWLYRKRLQEDFLIGIQGGHGHGIPAQQRQSDDHTLDFSDHIMYKPNLKM